MKFVALIFLVVAFMVHADAEETAIALFKTIGERLSYMPDVALYKAKHGLPIEDLAREKIVIEKAKTSAYEAGLDPEYIEDFFVAQISVAKAIQFRCRADLLSQPSAELPKDLNNEIRPHLIRLGDQIIQEIVVHIEKHGSFDRIQFTDFDELIDGKYVTDSDKKLLFEALLKIKKTSES
ncbi:gamma subclass chorismate mutase AroQ [Rubellicoccus peritrichatus]|uniref:chorismate mutase n=1 Tax=Rubellicoccus peritrichatus TaxID=3080537 RepID=A0AAQ3L794_9BACT|nr:gamma subclass chorismate mutase AroQ [Puniceicoccus sp. CR14]WOO39277.1 gamma subclass chorismate mutase AroQ [Puniceicoccus sp. CR14]